MADDGRYFWGPLNRAEAAGRHRDAVEEHIARVTRIGELPPVGVGHGPMRVTLAQLKLLWDRHRDLQITVPFFTAMVKPGGAFEQSMQPTNMGLDRAFGAGLLERAKFALGVLALPPPPQLSIVAAPFVAGAVHDLIETRISADVLGAIADFYNMMRNRARLVDDPAPVWTKQQELQAEYLELFERLVATYKPPIERTDRQEFGIYEALGFLRLVPPADTASPEVFWHLPHSVSGKQISVELVFRITYKYIKANGDRFKKITAENWARMQVLGDIKPDPQFPFPSKFRDMVPIAATAPAIAGPAQVEQILMRDLPAEIVVALLGFVQCEEILKLRLLSQNTKAFLERHITAIYANMRILQPQMPVVQFVEAKPGETDAEEQARHHDNMMLFRNLCMLAEKHRELCELYPYQMDKIRLGPRYFEDDVANRVEGWSQGNHKAMDSASSKVMIDADEFRGGHDYFPRWRENNIGRGRMAVCKKDEGIFRFEKIGQKWRVLWWEWFMYWQLGLTPEKAQLATALRLPIAEAKRLIDFNWRPEGYIPDEDDLVTKDQVWRRYKDVLERGPLALRTYYDVFKATQNIEEAADEAKRVGLPGEHKWPKQVNGFPSGNWFASRMNNGNATDDEVAAAKKALPTSAVQNLTGKDWRAEGLDGPAFVYNSKRTPAKILAMIKVQLMTRDKLKALLTKFDLPGLSLNKDKQIRILQTYIADHANPNFVL